MSYLDPGTKDWAIVLQFPMMKGIIDLYRIAHLDNTSQAHLWTPEQARDLWPESEGRLYQVSGNQWSYQALVLVNCVVNERILGSQLIAET